MSLETSEHVDAIVIGAGQAGLAAGYFLNKHQLKYVIFERGNIGDSWANQRWDSLKLDSPNWTTYLPGETRVAIEKDSFMSANDFLSVLHNYAYDQQIPIKEHHEVISLDKDEQTGLFMVKTNRQGELKVWYARNVIVASGMLNQPKIPLISENLPAKIRQLHSSQYRNADHLPAGNVLIVGSAKSGAQIAEELALTTHKVYLATSRVGRAPRNIRGKDIAEWGVASGFLNGKTKDVPDPAMLNESLPLVSGYGEKGHTLSLQYLHKRGVTLLGRLLGSEGAKLLFGNDAADNIRYGDQVSAGIKQMVDQFIEISGTNAPEPEFDEADLPDPEGLSASPDRELDISEHNITTVIWATGLSGSFGWVKLPVFDQQSKLVHDEGVSPIRGLFFLGFPWLRSRKSAVIYGLTDDASYIVERLMEQ